MARKEPPWLTAIYTVVGLFIIAAFVALAYLVVAAWPIFLMMGVGGAVYWWYTRSPAALERHAKEQTAVLLRQLAALDLDFPTRVCTQIND